jgi:predicted N-acetyltransferase YhbS
LTIEGPRGLKPEELESAVELADRVFRPGEDSSMRDEYPLLFREQNLDGLRVFAEDGRVVSLVGTLRRDVVLSGVRAGATCVGSVCTHPDYRGQGLATRLLDDARRKTIADGACLFLISGGRSLYRRLGYVGVGGQATWTVKPDRLPQKSPYRTRPWRPEDLPALVRLHSAEPVRFVRTPEDFATLLGTGQVVNAPGELRVIERRGLDEPVAYAACQVGGAAWEKKKALVIQEMAGARQAVVGALRALLEEHGARLAVIRHLDSDAEMRQIALSVGPGVEPVGFHGTVGIVEPARFWEACRPLFEERLGAEYAALSFAAAEQVRIGRGDETLELDGMSAFTRLVFLPAHRRGELELGLGRSSALAAILERLFPLPLVDYGLDFI